MPPKEQKTDFLVPKENRLLNSSSLEQTLRRHRHDGVETEILNNGVERIQCSFVIAWQNTHKLFVPFAIRIVKLRCRVWVTLGASDAGTVVAKDHNGNEMGTFTIPGLTAQDNDRTPIVPTTNNEIPKDSFYTLTSAKTTNGGEVIVSIEWERI